MRSEERKRPVHLGFLTALGNMTDGLIGGLLILNQVGRPVEFHCTAPVRPNKAQEILYGNTLKGFVCGEQIAPALVGRAKVDLAAVLTNNPEFMTASNLLSVPLGLVFSHSQETTSDKEKYAVWEYEKDGVKNESCNIDGISNKSDKVYSVGENEIVNNASIPFQFGRPSFFYDSLKTLPIVPGVDYSLLREVLRGKNRMAFPASFSSELTEKISFNEIVANVDSFLKFVDSVEPFERIRLAIEEAQKSC